MKSLSLCHYYRSVLVTIIISEHFTLCISQNILTNSIRLFCVLNDIITCFSTQGREIHVNPYGHKQYIFCIQENSVKVSFLHSRILRLPVGVCLVDILMSPGAVGSREASLPAPPPPSSSPSQTPPRLRPPSSTSYSRPTPSTTIQGEMR